MESNKYNIVFANVTGNYPIEFSANNTKFEYISRGLTENNCKVENLDSISGYKKTSQPITGHTKYNVSYKIYANPNKSIFQVVKNIIQLYSDLKERRNTNKKNILITETSYPFLFPIMWLYARLLRYEILHIITEWPLSFKIKRRRKIIYWLYVNLIGYFIDGFLPISESLIDKINHFHKPMLKVPILGEYKNRKINHDKKKQFVYCGNANYYRVISMVLEAFIKVLKIDNDCSLILVIYGREAQIEFIEDKIKELNISSNVKIRTQVSQDDLYDIYSSSVGLLIPLDPNNEQDKFRFSQKIAEYISTGTPIITGNVGEIPFYFTDNYNAYIAEKYTSDAYSNKMISIIRNLAKANEVGENGFQTGKEYFNYKEYGSLIINFFDSLN